MRDYINESTVLKFYIEQMKEDNITFLKGKPQVKEEIKNLIESLDHKEDIHQKIQVAKELWKVLFESSMSSILPDKRGYDSLFNYFE